MLHQHTPHSDAERTASLERDGFGMLSALNVLSLANNAITQLPDTFCQLTQLCEMKNLRRLDLRWNNFTRYPAVIDRLIARGCMVHA
ncbi:Leucine Rich repeats (2 copies) [Serratia rubidaea]|uniref:leucine-rich repeat domain-containing protein n=1 Tax=Serratia rubidaea TaxID=61652 RepID=UPI0006C766EE|nr:leucine-rich repeat domain-containing protein [Serratia rubidaea]CAI0773296.1 Leucine Rich repeats (2 copies) [Serratia rubidaea]CAI1579993.1 Leucine Rich repeats (2 copies) [Serratia rubidaea]